MVRWVEGLSEAPEGPLVFWPCQLTVGDLFLMQGMRVQLASGPPVG